MIPVYRYSSRRQICQYAKGKVESPWDPRRDNVSSVRQLPTSPSELTMTILHSVVSTPFIYFPRTRPASPLPYPLQHVEGGFQANPDWKVVQCTVQSKSAIRPNLRTTLFVPASRTFCMSQPIPFHLTIQSSAVSLAAFLPFSPTANANTLSQRKITRLQLMRQTTVDVRWVVWRFI